MGIDTNYSLKKQPFNISWKRYETDHNVTIPRTKVFADDTKFFAIGSCFANELRDALERNGFDAYPKATASIQGHFPDELKSNSSWGKWDERVHLQFYNTFSLRQEFEKAFGKWKQKDNDYFVVEQNGQKQYWDPYRRSIYTDTPQKFAEIKNAMDEAMKYGIMNADAVVITLGLIEVFRRKDNKRVTCQYNRHFVKHVDFELSNFQQNYENIRTICKLYFKKFPKRKIVLTVSPIPLAQTFRECDVVVANTESKSMLRTVAGQIAKEFPNVIYWPSYEICLNNPNSFKNEGRGRHVTRDRVDSIMGAFIQTHIDQPVKEGEEDKRYYA